MSNDSPRVRKIADRIQQTVAIMLESKIKDPRLGFVTVTDVRVTGDLQHASIFYTVYGDDKDRKNTEAALNSAKGLIRSNIGKALGIRLTPSIEFILDALPDTVASIEDALVAAKFKDESVARLAEKAQYAGEENPYKVPRKKDESFEEESEFSDDFDDLDDYEELDDEYDEAYEEDEIDDFDKLD